MLGQRRPGGQPQPGIDSRGPARQRAPASRSPRRARGTITKDSAGPASQRAICSSRAARCSAGKIEAQQFAERRDIGRRRHRQRLGNVALALNSTNTPPKYQLCSAMLSTGRKPRHRPASRRYCACQSAARPAPPSSTPATGARLGRRNSARKNSNPAPSAGAKRASGPRSDAADEEQQACQQTGRGRRIGKTARRPFDVVKEGRAEQSRRSVSRQK